MHFAELSVHRIVDCENPFLSGTSNFYACYSIRLITLINVTRRKEYEMSEE